MSESNKKKTDPKVKDVLRLLAGGALLTMALVMPGTAKLLKIYADHEQEEERKEWDKFNLWRLRQVLKRLEKQKTVEIVNDVVKITERGRKKLLRFDLESMVLSEKRDKNWRLVIYDIAALKKEQREIFRMMLNRMKFLQLQKSVYLTPFICDNEIEYLRQIFDIGDEVVVIKVAKLENEAVFKRYFGV